jgi:hypothetical protein
MWRKLWAKIRPFNIHTEQDERATRVAFDEIMTANGPMSSGIDSRTWLRREGWR